MPDIIYIGHSQYPDEQSIAFVVGSKRYTYALPNPASLDTILYLIRKVSIGKAFALAKRIGRLVQ